MLYTDSGLFWGHSPGTAPRTLEAGQVLRLHYAALAQPWQTVQQLVTQVCPAGHWQAQALRQWSVAGRAMEESYMAALFAVRLGERA